MSLQESDIYLQVKSQTGRVEWWSAFSAFLPLLMNNTYCEVHQNIPNFSLSLFHIFKSAGSSHLRSKT